MLLSTRYFAFVILECLLQQVSRFRRCLFLHLVRGMGVGGEGEPGTAVPQHHPYDNEEIKADFNALYQAMNGMPLREMDKVIYPVCKLCRDHEQAGFIEGIKVGMCLEQELTRE